MTIRNKYVIMGIRAAIILAFLALWQWVVLSGRISAYYTSYPTEILKDLIDFTLSGELWKHASVTLQEALLGLLFGSVAGIVIGVFLGQFRTLGRIFQPIIAALNGIPQLTLAPVYILWFGLGLTSKVFLAGLMVFFVVFFATYGAVMNMEPKLVESANLLGAGKLKTLWYVVLPSCTPWILSGVRTGLGASLIGAIVGEYMGASAGFGWMVVYASSYFMITRVMSCITILLLVGMLMNWGLGKLEKFLLKWRPASTLNVGEKTELP